MKKKNFIAVLLLICLIFPVFAACGSKNNKATASKIEIDYIKNLQLTDTNKTAYGIKKSEIQANVSAQGFAHQNNQITSSFIGFDNIASAKNNNPHEKNYLYSTSQTYENGNVEYDSNSVTKVTFKKNTTINEDVYDNKGNLIDSNTTVSQEEIPAQINKLYVSGQYIFMQFIPILSESGEYKYYEGKELKAEYVEVRPSSLDYDLNGISDFDTKNYYSSGLSQSFVVDSKTGYIYKIENFTIASIIDSDLVKDGSGNIYKMRIDNNGTLTFKDILPNKDVHLNGAMTDKYGYTFVNNDAINQVDNENKIIYYRNQTYVKDNEKNVYILEEYDSISHVFINGTSQPVDEQLTCFGLNNNIVGFYKGKRIYDGKLSSSDANGFPIIEDSLALGFSSLGYTWFDAQSIISWKDNVLYAYTINFDDCYNKNQLIEIEDLTKVSEDLFAYTGAYYIKVGNDRKLIDNVYYKTTLTGTTYYQLVRNGNSFELKQLEDKSYEQNVFIFQPINK